MNTIRNNQEQNTIKFLKKKDSNQIEVDKDHSKEAMNQDSR